MVLIGLRFLIFLIQSLNFSFGRTTVVTVVIHSVSNCGSLAEVVAATLILAGGGRLYLAGKKTAA